MDIIKVEPDSDEERHPVSSQNAYYMTDGKQNYPVHAEFFVVKSETEVSSTHKTILVQFCRYCSHWLIK
jgi:hypothetical protein